MQSKFSDGLELRKHWMLAPDMHFLNHGSFGATPRVVLAAEQQWQVRMESQPVDFMVRELPGLLRMAAGELANFLGAKPEDLAFVENATAAVNSVLRAYPWQVGDELLLCSHSYPAVKNAANFVARQFGIKLREFDFCFPLQDEAEMLHAFSSSITANTRMAIIDHISSPLAIIYPLQKMLDICRSHGVKTLVDGAHVPGMLPLKIETLGADWYLGNCHKWLFAPKGCAFLWAAPNAQDFLQPLVVSLRMDEAFPANFDWVGTRDPSAWLAITAALQFYHEMGGAAIPQRLHEFVIAVATNLAKAWQVELPAPVQQYGAMVTLPLPLPRGATQSQANALRDKLWGDYRIEVPLFSLQGRLWARISAQLYNVEADYEALAKAVLQLK